MSFLSQGVAGRSLRDMGEVFQACMSHREEAQGKTQDTLRDYVSRLAWERMASGVPPEELEEVSEFAQGEYKSSGFDLNVMPVWSNNITGNGVVVSIVDD
ncbi:hypothetical protein L3Q82_013604, partial [Scortum barcoo]